jgi:hypothetical protein
MATMFEKMIPLLVRAYVRVLNFTTDDGCPIIAVSFFKRLDDIVFTQMDESVLGRDGRMYCIKMQRNHEKRTQITTKKTIDIVHDTIHEHLLCVPQVHPFRSQMASSCWSRRQPSFYVNLLNPSCALRHQSRRCEKKVRQTIEVPSNDGVHLLGADEGPHSAFGTSS